MIQFNQRMVECMKKINEIPGYENVSPIYWVTQEGEVLSEYKGMKPLKQRITKPTRKSRNRYHEVCLMLTDGSKMYRKTHRIVASAFVDGDNSLQVNHIDEDGLNNHYTNLEWVTGKENSKYSNAKVVYQYDIEGLVRVYESVMDTANYGFNPGHVASVCRSFYQEGNSIRHKGFVFSYSEIDMDIVVQRLSKPRSFKPDVWRK